MDSSIQHTGEICLWAQAHPLLTGYHNLEWGLPQHNDQMLFEAIALDAFQAGLSWLTVLKKRENFRQAFDYFNPELIAYYTDEKVNKLLQNAGIIRNRQKIMATIKNAQICLEIQQHTGSFDQYIWQFTDFRTIHNHWKSEAEIPVNTRESDRMSIALKQKGFAFTGSTICYAMMQATGMVNDHTTNCYRHQEILQATS